MCYLIAARDDSAPFPTYTIRVSSFLSAKDEEKRLGVEQLSKEQLKAILDLDVYQETPLRRSEITPDIFVWIERSPRPADPLHAITITWSGIEAEALRAQLETLLGHLADTIEIPGGTLGLYPEAAENCVDAVLETKNCLDALIESDEPEDTIYLDCNDDLDNGNKDEVLFTSRRKLPARKRLKQSRFGLDKLEIPSRFKSLEGLPTSTFAVGLAYVGQLIRERV